MKRTLLFLLITLNSVAFCAEKKEKAEAQDSQMSNNNTGVVRSAEESVLERRRKRQKIDPQRISDLFDELQRSSNVQEADKYINEIKSILIEIGNVDIILHDEHSPLSHIALMNFDNPELNQKLLDLAKWLIDKNATIPAEALYYALEHLNVELIKLLLEAGACTQFGHPDFAERNAIEFILKNTEPEENENIKRLAILKELIINGTKPKIGPVHSLSPIARILYSSVLQELSKEYREKIDNYRAQAINELHYKHKFPKEIAAMVVDTTLPNYPTEQILDNIMEIRYLLGELSTKQKEIYEETQEILQQQHAQRAAAAARPIAPAQQAAAAMQD